MQFSKRKAVAVLGATAVGAALAASVGAAPADAAGGHLHVTKTISSDFVGPLQFAVSNKGIFVADSFVSALFKVGRKAPLATGPDPSKGGDIAGVTVNKWTGDLAFTTSNGDHSKTYLFVRRHGHVIAKVDLAAYERNHNPDKHTTYGTYSKNKCVLNALAKAGVPAQYTGEKDSHPYSVVALSPSTYAVGDAGGNDILRVGLNGSVHTIAVLPRVAWKVPADFVKEQGLPKCVVGITYYVEGVPTDVEVGPYGELFASSLPGGDTTNLGRIYVMDRNGNWIGKIGDGFNSVTNIAVTSSGKVYAAELGSGQISVLHNGHPKPVLSLPGVVAVEASGNTLYASVAPALIGGSDPGSIVKLGY